MEHKLLKINLLVVFLAIAGGSPSAQEASRIRNFAPADYAAQNQNWALAQSPENWLLVANNGGLLEFDGTRWRTFFLPERQTVRSVAVGSSGEIFCGGFAEFGFWKPEANGRLKYHSLSRGVQADNLQKEEIWHILPGPGFVLFQSFSTIYKFDYQKVVVLRPPHSIMFLQAVDGRFLFQAIGGGLYELMPDNSFRLLPGTEILAEKIVQFIVSDGHDGFWAGTTNNGIWAWTDGKMTPWPLPLNADFRKFQLNKALRLSDGGWAIGTILNGAYILNADGSLRAHLNRESGLQNNTVLSLLEDRQRNLWLGLDRGIDLVDLRSPLTFFTDQTGSIGTVYTAALFQNQLFIGTNQGVFVKKWNSPGAVFHLVEGTQGQVWQLQVFDNQLLCGHNAGTFEIDGSANARKISDVTGGWSTLSMPNRADVLVQGTYTGLVVFRKNAGDTGWRFSHRVSGFSEPLRKIVFDSAGNLWGANPNRGLVRLRLTDDLVQIREIKIFSTADGLKTDYKLDLANLGNRLIVNSEQASMEVFSQNEQTVFRDLPDSVSTGKWLPGSHANEAFLAHAAEVTMLGFGHSKKPNKLNLSLVPGYENIVALTPDCYLFCLENGFAILDKRQFSASPSNENPAPKIRWVEILGQDTLATEGQSALVFSAGQNSLRFCFAQPTFGQSPKFSWRLEGFSAAWSAWQTASEKEFTNLPPGRYRFVVRSDMSDNEAVVQFSIAPPWYQSAWAWVVYGLLALGVFFMIEKFNRRRLARQRQLLEAEKQRELMHQRTEAEREKLELEVESKSRDLSNAALNLIRKNETLQHLRDELVGTKNEPRALQKLTRLIDSHLDGDHDWEMFEESFNRVHDDFFKRLLLQFSELTPGDMRLAAYLKMNLSSKEIAPLLNISLRGVENKRYRLRKKLELAEDANLTEFIMAY